MAGKLVAAFSATDTTWRVAERLAKAVGADLVRIQPVDPYTAADLDWRDQNSRSTLERDDRTRVPQITWPDVDMSAYDTIYVGFPIWWEREPIIIDAFLGHFDLAGMRVVPFATSGGSGMGRSARLMEPFAKDATVAAGRVFPAGVGEAELAAWAAKA